MLERRPFYNKHLLPAHSQYSIIDNKPKGVLPNYMMVYVKNGRVYRRLFFNNFNYADKAYVAATNKLLGKDDPIWDVSKYVMENGRPLSRSNGLKRWIQRKTNWILSLKK